MLIFVIDDELPLLNEARRAIAEAAPDAEIVPYLSAKEALDAIKTQELSPNIVFSDIEMPGLSGLEFAVALKTASPNTRVVFVTGFSKYAVEAFKMRAHGYILKPLKKELVETELSYLPQEPEPKPEKLTVRCFGYFEVFWQGKPLRFERRQTKELLAYLVDRRGATCTSEEIIAALFEDECGVKDAKHRVRNLANDLKSTLDHIGMSDILIKRRATLAINADKIDCDYYRMLSGDMDAVNAFRGEYMTDYSWAELTTGTLFFKE